MIPAASAGGYTDDSYNFPDGKGGGFYTHTIAWTPGNGRPPHKYVFSSGDLPPGRKVKSDGPSARRCRGRAVRGSSPIRCPGFLPGSGSTTRRPSPALRLRGELRRSP